MMTQDSVSAREQHLSQAMDWLLHLQAEPENRTLRAEHAAWLEADPQHAHAWQHARHTWGLLQALPPTAAPAPRRRWPALLAVAAAACLMLSLFPGATLYLQADHLTRTGITRHITLPDGSTVHLGAASAIATDFSANNRHVRLLRGEAFFDVTPDPQRPFVVDTGKLAVTVLGTRFNVEIAPHHQTVAVAHGNVRVAPTHGTSQQLGAGEQLAVSGNWQQHQRQVAIDDIGAWRQGLLFVQDAPIADVAATLQRYQGGRTLIPNDTLAQRRVTGAYDLSHPHQALQHLVTPYAGQVRSFPAMLRLVTH